MSKEFDDLSSLTAEQQAAIQEFLYKNYSSRPTDDNTQFVIPFIAMNDGQTPAQIKASSQGIYKDIQRSPFLRKTGTFKADGSIEDIDITALVYYGTLQQAKVAPTLENIDVKLYVREPGLKKVPSSKEEGLAADTYFWREVHPGFHVYNNDTIYGYDWVVLQESYASTAGVYNLHMNIENGLGACKIGGHRSPVTLAGVQYKVVITAKSLWNREYSLLDSMPLIQNLEAETNTLAPSVNAIKEYYSKAVETAKLVTEGLFVTTDGKNNYAFTVDNNGIFAEDIKLKDIESLYSHVKAARADIDKHLTLSYNPALDSQYPHGLNNAGINGNINAHSLAGLTVSNAYNTVSEDITAKDAYIPYVNKDQAINLGHTVRNHLGTDANSPSFVENFTIDENSNFWVKDTVNAPGISDFKYLLDIPSTKLIARIRKGEEDNSAAIELSAGSAGKGNVNVTLNKLIANSVKIGDKELDKTSLMHLTGSSSLAYKDPISESLPIKFKENVLTPNVDFDQDGNPVSEVDLTGMNTEGLQVKIKTVAESGDIEVDSTLSGLTKLGSALQALHELPLSTYEYKGDQNSYKEQLGIFVERVNQLRNGLLKGDIKPEHKRNSRIKSNNGAIIDSDEGLGINDAVKIKDDEDERYYGEYENRVNNNCYEYTDEEVKSIAYYLDLMTSKQELSHDIKNTVGILLKAAQETQDRLLDVETAVYGWDASSIPGKDKTITSAIDPDLQAALNNSPLFLGLNRLMRALCLEVYDTTDLEKIDAETVSVATDSDTLKEKVTIKSRMDQIDILISRIQSEVAAQTSALAHMYIENVKYDECAHTYTDMYHVVEDKKQSTTDPETVSSEVLTKEEKLSTAPDVAENEDEATELLKAVEDSHETGIGTTYDYGNTWHCLPSASDLNEKGSVSFANVSENAGKHTPTKDECGIVRVPEYEDVKYNVVTEDGKTYEQEWKKLKLSKTKTIDSDGQEVETFEPVFASKVVAWDSAKLERVNKKLSEVTKTIYGVDDVVTSLPNRTEVLRRNITNLIDDLYPNRTFDVEPEVKLATDVTSDIRAPFKLSKVQNPAGEVARLVTDEEKLTSSHTSIIKYFDDALFNFTVGCNLINGSHAKYGDNVKSADSSNNGNFYWKSNFDHIEGSEVTLSTANLITDEATGEDNNSYDNVYSRLDYIENLIGVKDCYDAHLFDKDILTITGLRNLSTEDLNSSITKNTNTDLSVLQGLYNNEIGFTDLSVIDNAEPLENGKLSDDLSSATTTNAYLSRKLKTIQERVTTLEAYADEISKGMQSIHPNVVDNGTVTATRYEASDSTQVFKDLGEIIHDETAETLVYDLDLSESLEVTVKAEGKDDETISCLEHNRKVWSIVTGSKGVTKGAYTPNAPSGISYSTNVTGYYTLSGTYVRKHPDNESIELNNENGGNWTIHVLYCSKLLITELDKLDSRMIYLKSKDTAPVGNFTNGDNNSVLLIDNTKDSSNNSGAASYQNQTEANIYKTIQNLFNSMFAYDPTQEGATGPGTDSLYYKAMLRAHPVGTVYFTADANFKPKVQFGGIWKELPENCVIQTGKGLADNFANIDENSTITSDTNLEIKTTVDTGTVPATVTNKIGTLQLKGWLRIEE